nr:tRNA pseudouridine synthase A [Paeniglutamicibacter cryotolerans]
MDAMKTAPIIPSLESIGLSPESRHGGEPATVRLRATLAYDGAAYSGWGVQPTLPTVQGVLEHGLSLLIRRQIRTVVAGRTDAGVHASAQVVHFDLTPTEYSQLPRGKDLDPCEALLRRLYGILGRQGGAVVVHEISVAPEGFDARFSALWRRYSYRIADGPDKWDPLRRHVTMWHGEALDEGLMNDEAESLLGRHDFLTFCKPKPMATTIRTLTEFHFARDAEGLLVAHVKADAFCHNMVRSLIGAALMVGDGRKEPGWMAHRLGERVRDSLSKLAVPHALVLEEVAYPSDTLMGERAELTRARRLPGSDTTHLPPRVDAPVGL